MKLNPRLPIGLFVLCNIAFVLFFACLAYYCRLATDDFCGLGMAHKHGVIGAVREWWNVWSGRFSAQFLLSFWTVATSKTAVTWPYSLCLFVSVALSFTFFIRRFFIRFFEWKMAWLVAFNLSLFLIGLVFFASPDRMYNFFWIAGSAVHTWPLVFGLVALGCLLPKHGSHMETLVAAVCVAILAGMSEVTVVLMWLLLAGWAWSNRRGRFSPDAIVLGVLTLAYGVMITSPGSWQRLGGASHANLDPIHLLRVFLYFWKFSLLNFPLLLALAIVVGAVAAAYSGLPRLDVNYRRVLVVGLGIFGLFFIGLIPAAAAFEGRIPERVWGPLTLILIFSLFVLGFFIGLGLAATRRTRPIYLIGGTSGALYLFFIVSLGIQEIPDLGPISSGFDRDYALLQSLGSGCQGTVVLKKLPESNWIIVGEAMPNPDEWISTCYRDALGLPCQLRRATMSYVEPK